MASFCEFFTPLLKEFAFIFFIGVFFSCLPLSAQSEKQTYAPFDWVKINPEIKTEFAETGDLLVIGWGGTYGSLHSAVKQISEEEGYKNIGFAHFNYINPLPKNTGELLTKFKKIIVCELNNGQFAKILRINFEGFKIHQFNKIQGLPFGNNELIAEFKKLVD